MPGASSPAGHGIDQQAVARDVLGGLPQASHPASYFTWLPLPEDARADRVAAAPGY